MTCTHDVLPAHFTKHHPTLVYPFGTHVFYLAQLNDGTANGTALWLGAQCMSVFLVDAVRQIKPKSQRRRPKAIELGSGVGLTALVLASLGWDTLATDIEHVTRSVLEQNVKQNTDSVHPDFGSVQVRVLDWTVHPESWTWNNPPTIASHSLHKPDSEFSTPSNHDELFLPPFDLIVTSDTLYSPELITPLLRTIHHISMESIASTTSGQKGETSRGNGPPVYLALENRDPRLTQSFLEQAREVWKFSVERVPNRKVTKSLERGSILWDKEDWAGVEIWKLSLRNVSVGESHDRPGDSIS
ncbi:hypothetical protein BD410DRAFT_740300 [Rickenella mellea]|uniref:Uncharacterized protein n=1 Tax=Rickenella mellea TaxID=50990 RepID=A0A4Y7QKC8_9AGAM|nr:hypothetical protein BD410DRAFT_740300 [Rickenella mellea]